METFKKDSNDLNSNNNNDNFNTPQTDNILMDNNGEILEIETETMDYISNYIDNVFTLKNFSYFKTEKHILEYYYEKEKECLEHIDDNFREKKDLYLFFRNYTTNIIKEKYDNNIDISEIKTKIFFGIEKIIDMFKKNNNLNINKLDEIYLNIFKTKKIPKFIEKKIIEEIQSIQLINQLNTGNNIQLNTDNNNKFNTDHTELIKTNIDIIKEKKIENIEDTFIDYYIGFSNKEIGPFECGDKAVLFNILLYSNLQDIYKNEKIKNIFIDNYFAISECFKYYDKEFENIINNNKSQNFIHDKLIECFVKYKINDSHCYIISSYFYLIMNIMKDPNELNNKNNKSNDTTNINNPLFTRILKNLLYHFNIYCKNNIYNLEKYKKLVNYFNNFIIANGKGEKINKKYNLKDFENKIKCSSLFNISEEFNKLIKNIIKTESNKYKENNIELIPLTKKRHTNTITILISGFLSEKEDITSWKNFINYDRYSTNYYLFRWPSSDISTLIGGVIISEASNLLDVANKMILHSSDLFLNCKKNAKYCGKILSLFLSCNEEFNNCQINLVGFSLGCQVVKYCLKELEKIGHRDMINNVLFMGGATVMHEFKKNTWKKIFKKNVCGRIINCYSKHDAVLSYLFRICVGKNPIGLSKINLKDEKREYDIVEDYDFSYLELGHLDYRDKFDIILKKIKYLN